MCCGEQLLDPHYKGDNAKRQWLEDFYWPFAKKHSPSGPGEPHSWKFAVEIDGRLVIESDLNNEPEIKASKP